MINWGAAGNVIAYNYSIGAFDSGATNVVTIDFDMHGAHPQFNLLEGNVTPHIFPDSFWGSGSHNTLYRNWTTGTTKIAPFAGGGYTGRHAVDWASYHLATQQNRGISLAYPQSTYNVVGNIAGSSDATSAVGGSGNLFNTGPAACTSCRVAPGSRDYEGTFYAFDFAYDTGSDSNGSSVPMAWVGVAYSTAFIHGNYDTASAATFWDIHGSGSHTLPASFYLASKPSWFGSINYPAIGPDVSGGVDSGGHVYAIPAQACYENTAKDANGLLIFNPDACYAATPTPHATRSPSSMSYGNQPLGSATAGDQVVTFTNDGDAVLTITSIGFTGANTGDFAEMDDCGTVPAMLAAGAHCTITVTFMPQALGARSATLSIADDATGSPHTVALSGTGVAALRPRRAMLSTN